MGILIRVAGFAAIIGASAVAIVVIPGDAGVAIGVGILAFVAVAALAFLWSALDGHRLGFPAASVRWTVVAAVVAVGSYALWVWNESRLGTEGDVGEIALTNAGMLGFNLGLVLLPSLVGAAIGGAIGRSAAPEVGPRDPEIGDERA